MQNTASTSSREETQHYGETCQPMDDRRRNQSRKEQFICHWEKLQSSSVYLDTPTSLAEASALQLVACLVCSGHQGLGKAALGKDGAVGRTAVTGPMAGEITVILRG